MSQNAQQALSPQRIHIKVASCKFQLQLAPAGPARATRGTNLGQIYDTESNFLGVFYVLYV